MEEFIEHHISRSGLYDVQRGNDLVLRNGRHLQEILSRALSVFPSRDAHFLLAPNLTNCNIYVDTVVDQDKRNTFGEPRMTGIDISHLFCRSELFNRTSVAVFKPRFNRLILLKRAQNCVNWSESYPISTLS